MGKHRAGRPAWRMIAARHGAAGRVIDVPPPRFSNGFAHGIELPAPAMVGLCQAILERAR